MGRFHISATKFDALPRFKAWEGCENAVRFPDGWRYVPVRPMCQLGGGACEALPFRA